MDRLLIIQIAYLIILFCGAMFLIFYHLYKKHKKNKQRKEEAKDNERFLKLMREYRDGSGE